MTAARAAAAFVACVALVAVASPVYRDLFSGARDRYQGTSYLLLAGHLEQDRRLLRAGSLDAWLWNPDKGFGIPKLDDIQYQPLYPVRLLAALVLPAPRAWHALNVLHVLVKTAGLVLLGAVLGLPAWLVVAGAAGALLLEGSLDQFAHVTDLAAAAWMPLQLWLVLKARDRRGWSGWDTAWVLCAATRILGSNLNRVLYYDLLVIVLTLVVAGRRRREAGKLAARYALTAALLAPLLLPGVAHFAESARSHFREFEDWPYRRAYSWWNYWLRLADLRAYVLYPAGAWAALGALLLLARGATGPLTRALGLYGLLALLHNVRYSPLWAAMAFLPGVRIPLKAFEPLTWLLGLAVAEVAALAWRRAPGPLARGAVVALVVVAVAAAAWQTRLDPATEYVSPPYTRPLPERLASTILAAPRAQVLALTGPERADDARQPVLNSNHHLILGLPSARYFGSIPTYPFMRAAYRVPGLLSIERDSTRVEDWEPLVDLYAELGIRWIIWDGDAAPLHPRLRFVGEEHGFRLFEITEARPLVWTAPSLRAVPRPAAPRDVAALVYTLPAAGPFCYECATPPAAPEAARLDWRWRPGDVHATVESREGTWVVLGETRATGWRATVDGARAVIQPVNEMFQGVWVPAGRHEVAWRFREPAFSAGLGVGVAALLACAALPWARRRRA